MDIPGYRVLHPKVIHAKWTRNNHLVADELTVGIPWREGGVDPRWLKNARGAFWMWDDDNGYFDPQAHLRFTGICVKVERKLEDSGWIVEMTFHDYTTLFINNKPLKTSGIPEWNDSLLDIWVKICDNTGAQDPESGQIISSVAALRDRLIFKDLGGAAAARTLGELVAPRFLKISKPQPKNGASSWDFWQWCCGALGLISYIDKDTCVITNTTEHYKKEAAARLVYGQNIYSFEENVDTTIMNKGILLKSMNPLTGLVMESFYPKPGDDRLKPKRAAVGKNSEEGPTVTANEVSADYEEYNRYDIQDQTTLDRAAEEAYNERSRQEMEGSLKTMETYLRDSYENVYDILDLHAGDAISIWVDPFDLDNLLGIAGEQSAQVAYLRDTLDYDENLAWLVVDSIDPDKQSNLIYHLKSMEVTLGPDQFEVELKFHNLINITH